MGGARPIWFDLGVLNLANSSNDKSVDCLSSGFQLRCSFTFVWSDQTLHMQLCFVLLLRTIRRGI